MNRRLLHLLVNASPLLVLQKPAFTLEDICGLPTEWAEDAVTQRSGVRGYSS